MAKLYSYPWKWRDNFEKRMEQNKRISTEETLRLMKQEGEALDKLIELSNSLPPGQLVGRVISFPVADGKAFYMVVEEKPLSLAWIPFMDAYQIPEAHVRGLRKKDIEDMVKQDRAINELFAKKR